MTFEPMQLPYWAVPSWNPDVNEARANGEYPTAAWANQLQSLHDATIAKINEVGVLADSVTESVGVVAGSHIPGTLLIAGQDGSLKALPPGLLDQVLSPNANLPDGVEWKTFGGGAAAGDVLAFDGTKWVAVSSAGVGNGWFLRFDTARPSKVSWVSDATASGVAEKVSILKSTHSMWDDSGVPWVMNRRLDGIAAPAADLTVKTHRGRAVPGGSVVTLGVVGPNARPGVAKTLGTVATYQASNGAGAPGATLTLGVDGVLSMTMPGTSETDYALTASLTPLTTVTVVLTSTTYSLTS